MTSLGRTRQGLAAALAVAGPAALVMRAARGVRWAPPPSVEGKAMLTAYVLAVAIVEETLYRRPVSLRAGRGRPAAAMGTAAASSAVFVALHVRRDGAGTLGAHLINGLSWTGSALVGRSVRWSVAGHAAYNYVAMSVRAPR